AAAQDTGLEPTRVAVELACELLRVGHREAGVEPVQLAGVADLAAGLAVERGAVEDHDRLLAGLYRLYRPDLAQDRQQRQAHGLEPGVAKVGRRQELRDQVGGQLHAAADLAGRARGLALLLRRRVETGGGPFHPAFAGDVLGEVER